MRPIPPVERVRRRLRADGDASAAEAVPKRYERLGSVLLLRLPESARASFPAIGEAFRAELGVGAVMRHAGPVAEAQRLPAHELLAGGPTETTVLEHGVRYRFDAARILFSRGNKTERAHTGSLVRPGERVVDLFAGIGYFTLPAARADPSIQVHAVEVNPVAFGYLQENLRLNGVESQVEARLGDNRQVPLPLGRADRVILGYLPSSVPWVGRAIELLRPEGGSLHVHLLKDAHARSEEVIDSVRPFVEAAGRHLSSARPRWVKHFGPGRDHVVLDLRVGPV